MKRRVLDYDSSTGIFLQRNIYCGSGFIGDTFMDGRFDIETGQIIQGQTLYRDYYTRGSYDHRILTSGITIDNQNIIRAGKFEDNAFKGLKVTYHDQDNIELYHGQFSNNEQVIYGHKIKNNKLASGKFINNRLSHGVISDEHNLTQGCFCLSDDTEMLIYGNKIIMEDSSIQSGYFENDMLVDGLKKSRDFLEYGKLEDGMMTYGLKFNELLAVRVLSYGHYRSDQLHTGLVYDDNKDDKTLTYISDNKQIYEIKNSRDNHRFLIKNLITGIPTDSSDNHAMVDINYNEKLDNLDIVIMNTNDTQVDGINKGTRMDLQYKYKDYRLFVDNDKISITKGNSKNSTEGLSITIDKLYDLLKHLDISEVTASEKV